jgi:SecD/SecF fusion protein
MSRWVYWVSFAFIAMVLMFPAYRLLTDPQASIGDLFRLGIDLQGGTSLIYELHAPEGGAAPDADAAKSIILSRIDPQGTRGYIVRAVGKHRLEIILPGRSKVAVTEAPPTPENLEEAVQRALKQQNQPIADLIREKLDAFLGGTRVLVRMSPPMYLEDIQTRLVQEARDRMPDMANAIAVVGVEPSGDTWNEVAVMVLLPPGDAKRVGEWEALVRSSLSAQQDVTRVKRLVKQAGFLEFRIVADKIKDRDKANFDRIVKLKQEGKPLDDPRFRWYPVRRGWEWYKSPRGNLLEAWAWVYAVDPQTRTVEALVRTDDGQDVTGRDLSRAVASSYAGEQVVSFQMRAQAAQRFAKLTSPEMRNRQMAIILDGVIQSAPSLEDTLSTGGIIRGYNKPQELEEVVTVLNSGQLAASLGDPVTERTVGPELGEDNIHNGLVASLIGFALVFLFMAGYYLFAGFVADFAMILNLVMTICIMFWIRQTWTLPGIAGLILSLAMAVDANVLIYERLREEKGKEGSLGFALKKAYERAFRTIFDSNITTVIPAFILLVPGLATEEVKGFAIVMIIGLGISMFTAVVVTRMIFETGIRMGWIKEMRMFHLFEKPNFDWMKFARFAFVSTAILAVAGIVAFLSRGDEKYDIEFVGGTQVELALKPQKDQAAVPIAAVREITDNVLGPGATVQELEYAAEVSGPARLSRFLISVPAKENIAIKFVGPSQVELTVTVPQGLTSQPVPSLVSQQVKKAFGDEAEVEGGLVPQPRRTVGQTEMYRFVIAIPTRDGEPQGESAVRDTLLRAILDLSSEATVKAALAKAFEPMRPESAAETVEVAPTEITEDIIRQRLLKAAPAGPAGPPAAAPAGGGAGTAAPPASAPAPAAPASAAAEAPEIRYIPEEMRKFLGKILLTVRLSPPLSIGEVQRRIDTLIRDRFPESSGALAKVEGKASADTPGEFKTVDLWINDFYAGKHVETPTPQFWSDVVLLALARQETFASVTSFEPTMAREAWNKAVIAILLSLSLMAVYIWFRFAKFSSGIAAVVATVHDVLIALGGVSVAVYIVHLLPSVAGALMLTDMKVNLPLIGAFLTLVGYSVNDTIVVFDRIRENRGKYGDLSVLIINNSINQTLSRTVLTSSTVFVAVVALYFFGGKTSSIHGLAFVMLMGTFVGCYSSVAIASPILVMGDYLRKVYAWAYPAVSAALLVYFGFVWTAPWEGGFFASPAGWVWAALQLAWTYLVWDACHNLAYGRPWGLAEKAPGAAKALAGLSALAAPAAVVLGGIAVLAAKGSDAPAWAGPLAVLALATCPAAYALVKVLRGRTVQKS